MAIEQNQPKPQPPPQPPASSPAAIAVAERAVKEKQYARSVGAMAATAYAAIRQYEESIGGAAMQPWNQLDGKERMFWLDAATWVISERHIVPRAGDLQDSYPVAGAREPYKHLALEKRLRVYLFISVCRAFIECE